MYKKQIALIFSLLFIHFCTIAQTTLPSGGNVDFMRSNGKIFVVMTVVLVILLGLFVYLFSIDRKISKLENKH